MNLEHSEKVQNYFISAVLIATFIVLFLLFQPYLTAIILAFVLTVIFYPIFSRLLKNLGNRQALASIIMTLLIIIVVLIPVVFFLDLAFRQLAGAIANKQALIDISNLHLPAWAAQLNINLKTYISTFFTNTLNNIGSLFSNVLQAFIFLVLVLLSMFYFFKDGVSMKNAILDAIPFTNKQSEKVTEDLTAGIRAVIGGYVLVAIVQGTVSGIGFWIFGVPNPALWGFLTILTALIPTFGTSLVNIPAIVYLFATHNIGHGVGMFIWYSIAVVTIDNFVGPKFISGRVNIHILLIVLSIIGGIRMFGPLGFIIGPVILIFFWSVLQIFREKEVLPLKEGKLEPGQKY